jgi:LacI family transcriptional regulator
MANGRVTLKDVAAKVGVHPSTVSRVLNPATRAMVSPKIAESVTSAAKELGYKPNLFAYSLKTNRSFMIGVIIPDLTNPVFPHIVRGIEQVLGAANYSAMLANSDNSSSYEEAVIARMRGRHVDGLILATARRDDTLVADSVSDGLPVVLINQTTTVKNVDCVLTDDAAGIALAVNHLAELGHSRIAHIAGPQTLSTGYRRVNGFRAAMASLGLPCPAEMVAPSSAFTEDEGRRAFEELMTLSKPPTAVVAGNDMQALGCYAACEKLAIVCPADISIIGFNDMPIVDRLAPPLTTVSVPLRELGRTAARAILAQIDEGTRNAKVEKLTPQLIVRGSTAARA